MSTTKLCPYCAEEIRSAALKCRYCASYLGAGSGVPEWTRSEHHRMIAGVCAGLAERLHVSVTVVRLAFVLGALAGFGTFVILYVILWVVMPLEDQPVYRDRSEFSTLDDPLPPPDRPDYL